MTKTEKISASACGSESHTIGASSRQMICFPKCHWYNWTSVWFRALCVGMHL